MPFHSRYFGWSQYFTCDRCGVRCPIYPWGGWYAVCANCFRIPVEALAVERIVNKYVAPHPYCSLCKRKLKSFVARDLDDADTARWVCPSCIHPDKGHHWCELDDVWHCENCGALRIDKGGGLIVRYQVGGKMATTALVGCSAPELVNYENLLALPSHQEEFIAVCRNCSHEFVLVGRSAPYDVAEAVRNHRRNWVGRKLFHDWAFMEPDGSIFDYLWCWKCGQLDIADG